MADGGDPMGARGRNEFIDRITIFWSSKFLSFSPAKHFFFLVFVLRTWVFEVILSLCCQLSITTIGNTLRHFLKKKKKRKKPNNGNKITGSKDWDQPRQLKSFWVAEQSFLLLQFQSCWKLSLSWIPLMRNLSGPLYRLWYECFGKTNVVSGFPWGGGGWNIFSFSGTWYFFQIPLCGASEPMIAMW